jgi:hypothetical protein
LKVGGLAPVSTTSARYTTNPLTLDFAKMGTPHPTLMDKNALEVTAPLQYTTVHVLANDTQSKRAGPSNYGYLLLVRSRLRQYQKFEQM